MEALDFENVKKASTILRYIHLKSIAKLFRIVEIFLGLALLTWTSIRLPFAIKVSGEYFRHIVTIAISPLFIFLLSNLIVLTLLFKAGHILSGAQSPAIIYSETETENDLYGDFVKTSHNCMNFTNLTSSPDEVEYENLTSSPDEVEYEDKETIFEVSGASKIGNSDGSEVAEPVAVKSSVMKAYSRSISENFDLKREFVEEEENNRGKLRRSETEKCRKVANPSGETVYIFDELSNEAFQQTIEAFIAKQINFHREEKLAIVLHSHS